MTLRTKTLTAVAALTLAAGGAWAQDTQTTTAPVVETPAVTVEPTVTVAPAETPAVTAPVEEAAPAAEPALPETGASDSVSETQAEISGQPEPEPDVTAVEVTPAEDNAPAGTEAETAEEMVDAAEPTVEETPVSDAAAADADVVAAENDEPAAAEEHTTEEPAAAASHDAPHINDISFSFEGPFGKYDQHQLQRGLQVFTEVCSACHGLKQVPLRTLSDPNGPGLPEDQVRAYAAELSIFDPELDEDRPRVPTDHFPTVSGEGMGPDLSLMAKARAGFHGPYGTGINQFFRGIGGPEYIHAILTEYSGETKDEAGSTFYENHAFSGGWIQMVQPLMDDQVTYEDGTPATMDQMARDVSAFLMWTAEPKLMDRKQVGLISVLFLVLLTALLYLTNKRIWWKVKHPEDK